MLAIHTVTNTPARVNADDGFDSAFARSKVTFPCVAPVLKRGELEQIIFNPDSEKNFAQASSVIGCADMADTPWWVITLNSVLSASVGGAISLSGLWLKSALDRKQAKENRITALRERLSEDRRVKRALRAEMNTDRQTKLFLLAAEAYKPTGGPIKARELRSLWAFLKENMELLSIQPVLDFWGEFLDDNLLTEIEERHAEVEARLKEIDSRLLEILRLYSSAGGSDLPELFIRPLRSTVRDPDTPD